MAAEKKLSGMKCGECIFFKAYPREGKHTCIKEGIREFAKAPEACFVPDVTQLQTNVDQFAAMCNMFHSFNKQQMRICLYTLKSVAKSSSKEYPIGTKIYILRGEDYLSNYLAAYVLQYIGNTVVISGSPKLSTKGKSFIGYIDKSSILSYADFQKKRSMLIKAGKIEDPKNKFKKSYSQVDDYEPDVPTIDSVPEEWLTKREENKKKKDAYERLTQYL